MVTQGIPCREVALLAGGHVSEHAISLRSSSTLRDALLAAGFRVHPVVIAIDGTWNLLAPRERADAVPAFPAEVRSRMPEALVAGTCLEALQALRDRGVDLAVIGLHGPLGEDGRLQGLLESAGFAYTGSGVLASSLCMDKVLFKHAVLGAGLPTPAFEVPAPGVCRDPALRRRWVERLTAELGLPLVLKPSALGSSVGITIAGDAAQALSMVAEAASGGLELFAERFVKGRELTCAVRGSGASAQVLPVIEIVPRLADWFDAASKYTPEGADEIVPARIPDALARQVQELARTVHVLVQARGLTRTDFIVDADGRPWILETNTLPGMTRESLVPKAALAAGLSLPELVRELVADAVQARSSFPFAVAGAGPARILEADQAS